MSDDEGGPLDALPGLARVAATTWWHTTEWAIGTSARLGVRLVQAATSPRAAVDLAQDVRDGVSDAARDIAGSTDIEDRIRSATPGVAPKEPVAANGDETATPPQPASARRERRDRRDRGQAPQASLEELDLGAQLLRKSADVRYEVDAHPAYERILSELAPDEGRVLRLLLERGPQAAVDVRTGGPLGLLSSDLVAPGLTMIGARAGVRYRDRVPSYLNNLFRLGLIWFSREHIPDMLVYQVLEAQPDVLEAKHRAGRSPKVVRRSIHLTPFGEDFCRVCLALGAKRAGPLPEHTAPRAGEAVAQPPAAE